MKTFHLTEEQLQQYVLENNSVDILTREHIMVCQHCQASIKNYELLFSEIKQQPNPVFDFALSELVLSKLPAAKPKPSADNWLVYLFVLAATALTGTAIFYFRSYLADLFNSITPLLIYLTATTVTTLVILLGLDMYKTYQKKMRSLEFY